jgi:Secretion system C-terminal sorting domain
MKFAKSKQWSMLSLAFSIIYIVSPAQHWQALQGGLDSYTTNLYSDTVANKLYVGGAFTSVNHETQWGIASWNSTQWDSLGHGIDDASLGNRPLNTYAMARHGNYLYIGGAFKRAGNLNTPAFARWDGTNWGAVPGALMTDVNDEIRDIIVYNNEIYVCGSFDSIGSTPANCIAKWDGISWQAIGNNYPFTSSSIQLTLYKVKIYNGNLYVIGNFFDSAGNLCRMAKWDGANWIFFTNAFPGSAGVIYDIEVFNNKLYLGGLFSMPSGKCGIVSWNDTALSGVGGGTQIVSNLNPTVIDMCVHNGKLYCVGNFEKIGGIAANGLATWDDTNWCGYSTDFENNNQSCGASNIAFYNDTMYLGGGFQTVNGDSVFYITKWIGGSYIDTCGFISTSIIQNETQSQSFTLSPNPSSGSVLVQFPQTHSEKSTIEIYSLTGELVYTENLLLQNENQQEIDLNFLAEGMYLVRVKNGEYVYSQKLILQD